jgi:NAD(P)-dependent dehydrogenase (short-subunit alcohol dehydrogenase family)
LNRIPAQAQLFTKSTPILLLLGAGSNVGRAVAKLFLQSGYQVALPANGRDQDGAYTFNVDLSAPDSVSDLFAKVEEEIGCPLVVVYNGKTAGLERKHDANFFAAMLMIAESHHRAVRDLPLSIPLADFAYDLQVNSVSAYAAA